jgi:Epoxide hydrolase N terminus
MSEVRPYKIDVPQAKLDRLKQKLDDYQWPTELENVGWDYGTPQKDIKRFYDHWKNKFDWRAHEKHMNDSYPQFETTVNIDGFGDVDIHFLHQKSDVKGAIPLCFVHGWPGSFLEVTKMIPLLQGGDGKPAFHIVAPSMVNYAFSQGVFKRGFHIGKYAEACHKVMLALGYDQYVTQGGDWGYLITRAQSYLYPEHVKGVHVNVSHASAAHSMR